jgi:hypothetical protein
MNQIDYKSLMIDKTWDYINPNERDMMIVKNMNNIVIVGSNLPKVQDIFHYII